MAKVLKRRMTRPVGRATCALVLVMTLFMATGWVAVPPEVSLGIAVGGAFAFYLARAMQHEASDSGKKAPGLEWIADIGAAVTITAALKTAVGQLDGVEVFLLVTLSTFGAGSLALGVAWALGSGRREPSEDRLEHAASVEATAQPLSGPTAEGYPERDAGRPSPASH